MDFDRPVTRWRRESRPLSRAAIENERPVSRRGNINSGNIGSERPRVIVKPPSNSLYITKAGSRISSAIMQPDRTPMMIHSRRERPISQQGLGGLRTGTSKGVIRNRQVQDLRYFQGVLKVKMGQLTSEMMNLKKRIVTYSRERAAFLIYDKRVKETAAELTEAQKKLGSYNLAIDKINMGGDISKLLQEAKELTAINNSESAAVEMLFMDRKRREEAVSQLEKQLEMEKHKTEELISEMGPKLRDEYNNLSKRKFEIENEMDGLKNQLKSLTETKTKLNKQLSQSPAKVEVVMLETKLLELKLKSSLQDKKDKSETDLLQDKDSLLAKVKHDNANIISMDRAINEIEERIRQAQEILTQKEHAPNNTARLSKYLEWRNRQKSIESFLSSVEASKKEEINKLSIIENEIMSVLKELSVNLAILPTAADYKSLEQDSPKFKTDTLNTTKSLTAEQNNLLLYKHKVEIMDKEVKLELANLKNKLTKMSMEIVMFDDMEGLCNDIEKKQVHLAEIKEELDQNRPKLVAKLRDSVLNYNSLKQQLVENEKNAQVMYLEKKLSSIEQSNFTLMDFIPFDVQKRDIEKFSEITFCLQKKLNSYIKSITPD